MSSISTVEELCNLALDRVGYPRSIGFIYSGTREARIALRAYAQTRDDLLRNGDWGFAQRETTLTLLKAAPVGGYLPNNPWTTAFPQLPWNYEYAYPSDCLKVRAIRAGNVLLPNYAPVPNVFNIANDSSQIPAAKVILCNVLGAVAVYTGQITDMTTWEPAFVEALVEALARRFAQALGQDPKQQEMLAERAEAVAASEVG